MFETHYMSISLDPSIMTCSETHHTYLLAIIMYIKVIKPSIMIGKISDQLCEDS